MNCDPQSLANAARCFRCLDPIQQVVKTHLLCQWSNALGGGGFSMAPPSPGDWSAAEGGSLLGKLIISITGGTCVGPATAFYYRTKLSTDPDFGAAQGPFGCTIPRQVIFNPGDTVITEIAWSNGTTQISDWSASKSVTLSAIDPRVTSWMNRVVANGGALPSNQTRDALNTFVLALDSASITSKIIAICAIVPDNLIAAITPFLFTAGADPWGNNNFVGGDLTINGLLGNGSNKWLTTGLVPSSIFSSDNDAGISLYCFTTNNNANEFEIGVFGTVIPSSCFQLSINWSDVKLRFDAWENADSNGETQVASPNLAGFYSVSRVPTNDARVYFANSSNAWAQKGATNTNVTGGSRTNLNLQQLIAFATLSGAGTAFDFTTKRISFIAVHKGLTSGEGQSFYNAVQALRVALGGGFV